MFIIAGGSEDENLEKEVLRMKRILEDKGFSKKILKVEIIPEGMHSEWFWRREFLEVYNWLSK
jgi:alpha-glucosidase